MHTNIAIMGRWESAADHGPLLPRSFRHAPVLIWLRELRGKDQQGYAKCVACVKLLEQMGHELRRPIAGTLRDGIYELRARRGHVNYRLLYFFHGMNVAILAHALASCWPSASAPSSR
jgi:hypothetical protein